MLLQRATEGADSVNKGSPASTIIRVELRTVQTRQSLPAQVFLRELSGFDELCADSVTELIDRLLIDRPGSAFGPGQTGKMSLSDTDLVTAELYRHLYGDDVEAKAVCSACGSAWSVSFTLTDLIASSNATSEDDLAILRGVEGPDTDGVYSFEGSRFRLPTGEDLAAVSGLEPGDMERAMRTRCVLQQDPQHDDEIVDRAMSLVGPTLDTDLEATCSECGSEQSVPFRIDEFLLAALRRESVLLTREVHELALAYRWSRREILEIPREERRQYAGLVLAYTAASGGWS